jgi:transcriptional regulator with XRE-family HTH domain
MNALGKYIRTRASEQSLSLSEVCRRAGTSRQTLYALSVPRARLPDLETLTAIALALDVHPIRLVQLVFEDHRLPNKLQRTQVDRGDRSIFVRDVTVPDGEVVYAGTRFTKVWEVQNVGTVAWERRHLECVDDDIVVYAQTGEVLRITEPLRPAQRRIEVPFTAPGAVVQLSVDFEAPRLPCTCFSYWKSFFEDGTPCFPEAVGLSVKVRVVAMSPTVATVMPTMQGRA